MFVRVLCLTGFLVGAVWLVSAQAPKSATPPSVTERLERHRNLGKAFYENPTTQAQAVDEFRKAMQLAPGSSREELNYGLALLRAGKTPEGIAQLEAVQKKDPKLPHTYFNLGVEFKKQGESAKALEQFQQFARLVPNEPMAHYNIGVLLKMRGNKRKRLPNSSRPQNLIPISLPRDSSSSTPIALLGANPMRRKCWPISSA